MFFLIFIHVPHKERPAAPVGVCTTDVVPIHWTELNACMYCRLVLSFLAGHAVVNNYLRPPFYVFFGMVPSAVHSLTQSRPYQLHLLGSSLGCHDSGHVIHSINRRVSALWSLCERHFYTTYNVSAHRENNQR